MFILSIGMPKSGSTLFASYQRALVKKSFLQNGQQAFQRMTKEGQIAGIGHFVENFNPPGLLGKLVSLSEAEGPFVVKTHSPLTPDLNELLLAGTIKASYIHRDPRDVVLSAMDHGKRADDNPSTIFFRQYDSVENTLPMVGQYCRIGVAWLQSGLVEVFKYRELIENPATELKRFSKRKCLA